MTTPGMQAFDKPLQSTERADYLDTQTLAGGDGYFHTENDPTHATDGSAKGTSPETPLVKASRGDAPKAEAKAEAKDDYESWTNAQLLDALDKGGIEVPKPANKANLVAALRGE